MTPDSAGRKPPPGRPGDEPESLHDPVRARLLAGGGLVALGAVFQLVLGVPVSAVAFHGLVVGWLLVSLAFFRAGPGRERRGGRRLRIGFFALEVAVAVGAGALLSASPWLAVLLVLFPTVEWNLLRPGAAGLIGGALGGAAAGVVVAGTALDGAPAGVTALGTAFGPTAAIVGFLSSVVLGTALCALVAGFSRAGRRVRAELREVGRELERSHREAREAYEELRSTQAELVGQAKLATLGQLVAGVAHEINTPLGALNSNHDITRRALDKLQVILEDEKVTPDELGEVRRIVKAVDGVQETSAMAVERMMHLVKSLRSFGRPDRSEVDRVDLHEGIESTLEIVDHELGDGIRVVKEYGELPPITCLPHQLNQVFMNLILNGAQAMQGEGTLTIRTESLPDREAVAVRIDDTGSGIAPEHLDRIFEPGFTTKGSRMGMGLGLLITRQIVDRHGGRIEVESEVGAGTTFTVVVPVELPEDAVDEETNESSEASRTERRGVEAR